MGRGRGLAIDVFFLQNGITSTSTNTLNMGTSPMTAFTLNLANMQFRETSHHLFIEFAFQRYLTRHAEWVEKIRLQIMHGPPTAENRKMR